MCTLCTKFVFGFLVHWLWTAINSIDINSGMKLIYEKLKCVNFEKAMKSVHLNMQLDPVTRLRKIRYASLVEWFVFVLPYQWHRSQIFSGGFWFARSEPVIRFFLQLFQSKEFGRDFNRLGAFKCGDGKLFKNHSNHGQRLEVFSLQKWSFC